MGKEDALVKAFNSDCPIDVPIPFTNKSKAVSWWVKSTISLLKKEGYTIGSMCIDMPIGFAKGVNYIAFYHGGVYGARGNNGYELFGSNLMNTKSVFNH